MSESDFGTIPERMKALQVLRTQFGSLDEIPEDSLDSIGYVRLAQDGLMSVVPIERAIRTVVVEAEPVIERTVAEKYAQDLPFGSISFDTKRGSDTYVVTVSRAHVINELEELYIGSSDYAFDPLRGLLASTALLGLEDTEDDWLLRSASQFISSNSISLPEDNYLTPLNPDTGESTWGEGEAKALMEALDLLKAKVGDADYFAESFASGWFGKSGPVYEYLVKNGLTANEADRLTIEGDADLTDSIADEFMHIMQAYLEKYGLEDVATGMTPNASPDEMVSYLKHQQNECRLVQSLVNQQNELKKRQKSKDLTQEERRDISAELSQAKNELKNLRRRLQVLIDYLSLPQIVATYYSREITDIQKLLNPTASHGNVSVRIDATYDEEKDKDPGAFTGDCTAGKPLPFADPNTPVYNLKVYGNDVHMGNMYLVSSTEADGTKNWHIEAVQIRSRAIDWNSFPDSLRRALGSQAAIEGINRITVNAEPHLISNYSYIGMPMFRSCDDESVPIDFPRNPDTSKYSDFQGSSMGLVFWSRS